MVGNKSDLVEEREVSYEEGLNLAHKYGTLFCESSARNGLNVNESFLRTAREARNIAKKVHSSPQRREK